MLETLKTPRSSEWVIKDSSPSLLLNSSLRRQIDFLRLRLSKWKIPLRLYSFFCYPEKIKCMKASRVLWDPPVPDTSVRQQGGAPSAPVVSANNDEEVTAVGDKQRSGGGQRRCTRRPPLRRSRLYRLTFRRKHQHMRSVSDPAL